MDKRLPASSGIVDRNGRKRSARLAIVALLCLTGAGPLSAAEALASPSPYARWTKGPSSDPSFFPIAVWLQNPKNATRYKAAGINVFVAVWRGPTEAQLQSLKEAGVQLICSQNSTGLSNKNNPTIIGWMHGDEPDNAQSLPDKKGYGPPIKPEVIARNYEKIRAADPSRPVLLNLGQGVAWDNYIGRGVRRNHPEDYREYVKGCDIASFDIYPAVHSDAPIAGKLEYVGQGVERLRGWAGPERIVWNCIECSRISNVKTKPTPAQIRTEVWMSLIQGSRGIIYFVHQFKPNFQEASLLEDEEMLAAVTSINREIRELAPVLNSPTVLDAVDVQSSASEVPIACLGKRYKNATYLFAVNMRNQPTRGTFRVAATEKASVQVLQENRSVPITNNGFGDEFAPYAVHLYRIGEAR